MKCVVPAPFDRSLRVFISVALFVAVSCGSRNTPSTKAEWMARGDQLVGQTQYGQAIAAYQEALRYDSRDGNLRLKLATTYVASNDWPRGSAEAVRGADLLPKNNDAQLLAASLLLALGGFADAADRAKAVLQQQPNNVNALILWADAKARLGFPEKVLAALEAAMRPGQDYYRALRDIRPLNLPRSDEAEAEKALRDAVRLAPHHLVAQLALANFLWSVDRADDGVEALRAAADGAQPTVRANSLALEAFLWSERRGSDQTLTVDASMAEWRYLPYDVLYIANRALGGLYLSRQRNTEGERYLKAALELGDWEAGFPLVDFYARTGRDSEALAMLNAMDVQQDASGAVSLRAATIEFRQGKREEAMRRIDRLLAREPRNSRAALVKAQFSLATGDIAQALPFGRTAVAGLPHSSEAHATLAQALEATGDLEDALKEYIEAIRLDPAAPNVPRGVARVQVALGRGAEALPYARDEVRRQPNDPDAGVLLVRALVLTGEYAEAAQQLKQLVARYPDVPAVLVQVGTVQSARGNADAARAAYARARQMDPDSLDALTGLISLELRARRPAAARQLLEPALSAHPKEPGYLLLAARVFAADNDASRAESTLRHVLDLDPGNVNGAVALAEHLTTQRRADEARGVLEQIIQRRPGAVEPQTALAHLLEQTGHVAEARTQFEKIVARNPRAAGVASYRLAALYADQGANLDVALSLAIAAKQQRPQDSAVDDTLGWVYVRKNLGSIGLPHLQTAVRAEPENPVYHYHLGSAYLLAGQLMQARDELTRALEIDPKFAGAELARKMLGSMRK